MSVPGLLRVTLAVALTAAVAVHGDSDVTVPVTPPTSEVSEEPGDGGEWPPAGTEPALPPSGQPPQSYFERLPLEGRPFGQLDGFSPRQGPPLRTCHRPAVCQPLRHGAGHGYGATCLGTALRFASTSLNLTDFSSQESLKEDLSRWEALQHIPKCWSVIQPFLCAVYMPKCENDSVELPSLEMCQKVRGPCRFAEALFGWPAFLECDEARFPSKCRNSMQDLKFNTTTSCLSPLVPTKNKLAFYPTVEGCAPPCQGLLYSTQERHEVHRFIHVFGGLSFALTLLTVLTHIIDWRSFSKYAANRCIFYINFSLCLAILGFLVQFLDESRDTVVCHRDGTLRGPGSEESATPCTAVFILIYYPVIAAFCWFVMLTFSWNITFKTFGQSREIQERLDSMTSYFHLISWSVPLILTTAALATSDVVDSNYIYGVCFVGFGSWRYRLGFVLMPALAATLIGGFFLIRSVHFLVRQKPEKSEKKRVVNTSIARLCVCGLLLVTALAVSVACHVLEYGGRERQEEDVRDFLLCQANTTYRRYDDYSYGYRSQPACQVTQRPAPVVIKVHVFCLFAVGIVFSSWVWRRSTLRSWNRFYRRVVGKPEDRPVRRIRKHQVIAQAWSKRYELAQNGRISLSFHSTHSDPVGMYLGLNSGTSDSPSSSFFAAIPSLMERRGALIGSTSSALGLSRNSDGSLYSLYSRASRHSRYSRTSRHSRYSRRLSHDSDMSRRHSLDSTRSLYRSEADRVVALLGGRRRGRRRALADVRRAGRLSTRLAVGRSDSTLSRRSSSVLSQASSSISSQLLGAMALTKHMKSSRSGRSGRAEPRRTRRGTGVPAAIGLEPESGGSAQTQGGRDNASYIDSEQEEVWAGRARHHSHEEDGRRSAASSKRAASRQSRGQSSNVSSGSSIINLRQRLLGDVVDFARARRKQPASARDASPPWTEAAIELTKLPGGSEAERDNQALVSVAVQTTPSERRRAPGGAEPRGSLTLHNDLRQAGSPPPPERLNNGRRSPYTKNAQRLSLPRDTDAEEGKRNASPRSAEGDDVSLESPATPQPEMV
ncbi:smoothened homolog [Amphibalanus amphitrite]|uniref:smoothened homolog n=1 Tax=Amphibalanus amphitrite TaxID=1232801 RepID=UPI001C913D55|nr:smoothened homolog [Amphibalanus amphitrite]XP_043214391.1 smoothened homolog [Amphibalanus amphitrite]